MQHTSTNMQRGRGFILHIFSLEMKHGFARRFVMLCLLSFILLAGCTFPGGTKPVVKIGLIAPFEGELRSHGYQRLYGVKLALQEINLSGGVAGHKVELVALNDHADVTETTLQAYELVLDSDVVGVIGQWDSTLLEVSEPIYTNVQLAVVRPNQFTHFNTLPPTFQADFEALGGTFPDRQAQQAYLATYYLIQAIGQASSEPGSLARTTVLQALSRIE